MKFITDLLIKLGILSEDLDYHLIRASMVIIFLFFGYQKWFQYEADALIPYISHGPLIFWMYPVFGIRGATYFFRRFRMAVLGHCCSQESGTRKWEFSGLSAPVSASSRRALSFRSCRMGGLHLPENFPQ